MTTFFSTLVILAAIAVFISLVLGLAEMVRKKSSDKRQTRLMQARIGFQLVALILFGVVLALK